MKLSGWTNANTHEGGYGGGGGAAPPPTAPLEGWRHEVVGGLWQYYCTFYSTYALGESKRSINT